MLVELLNDLPVFQSSGENITGLLGLNYITHIIMQRRSRGKRTLRHWTMITTYLSINHKKLSASISYGKLKLNLKLSE